MLEPFQPAPTTNGERFTPAGDTGNLRGVLEHLAGIKPAPTTGQPSRGNAGTPSSTTGQPSGMLARLAGSNQPTSTNHGGNVSPLCNVSPPLFRNPQNAPLPTTGQPSRDAANVREIKPAFSTNGAIFGAILAHSPHVVGCIY